MNRFDVFKRSLSVNMSYVGNYQAGATNLGGSGSGGGARTCTHFLIANQHLFTSDRQIALVSSAGIPLRQRSPHIDIVHLYKARGIENRHSAPC